MTVFPCRRPLVALGCRLVLGLTECACWDALVAGPSSLCLMLAPHGEPVISFGIGMIARSKPASGN